MTSISPAVQFNARSPFTRGEALKARIPTRALTSGSFHKVFYDMYVDRAIPITPDLRAKAILRISPPGAHVSHHTAAEMWGATTPAASATHVTVPTRQGRCVRQGVKAHVNGPEASTTYLRGVHISTPEQSLIDLASSGCELVDLVVAGDSLVKAKCTTPRELIAAAQRWAGRGRELAVRAAKLVRKDVDSPMETRLRLLLVFAGLPEPKINLILRGADGGWRMRFDLSYQDFKLIVEYDGRQHAEDSAQWTKDIFRREDLDRMGWRLIIITAEGIYTEPERTLERVRDALIECGALGIRRHFKSEWRRHFRASTATSR